MTRNPSEPQLSLKFTPIVTDGITIVDLGEEMGQSVPVARPLSVPPSSTQVETVEYDRNLGVGRVARHGSLPPPGKLPKVRYASPVVESIEEMDEEDETDTDTSNDGESVGATEPPPQDSGPSGSGDTKAFISIQLVTSSNVSY